MLLLTPERLQLIALAQDGGDLYHGVMDGVKKFLDERIHWQGASRSNALRSARAVHFYLR